MKSNALNAFLENEPADAQDRIAQRSVLALIRLAGLTTNAYDRGDGEGFNACNQGQQSALLAFAFINTTKRYHFASQLHPLMDPQTDALVGGPDPLEAAQELLAEAEETYDSLKSVLTPVCKIHGCSSVVILRGDHARAAFEGVHVANDR